MKKIIFLLLLAIESINSQAQIQRYFWGLELGRSTKTEVKSFLNKNNIEFDEDLDGSESIITTDRLSLGGYSWTALFSFYNGIFCTIQLNIHHLQVMMNGGSIDYHDISTNNLYTFNELKRKLKDKYPTAKTGTIPGGNSNLLILGDSHTILWLELDDENNLELIYDDKKIASLEKNADGL